jgi:hypothetical protein
MGQKYAAYNAQGTIVAFYDSVDSPVPKGTAVIQLNFAEWQTCLAQPGWTVVDGKLTAPPTEVILSQARGAQKSQVNSAYKAAILLVWRCSHIPQ